MTDNKTDGLFAHDTFGGPSKKVTFSELASRPRTPVQTSSHLWDKAYKIMGTHPKCLKRELFNGTWYRVSPSQTYTHHGQRISYAIARPERLGAETDVLFVVPDNDFGKLVQINRYGEIPLTVYRPDDVNAPLEEVDPSGFDAILGSLLANVELIADKDRGKYKRIALDYARRAKRKLQNVDPVVWVVTAMFTVMFLVIGGLIWGAAASESPSDKAAKFDEANPSLVIQGTEVHLGESKQLDAFAPDKSKGIPLSPSNVIEEQPRLFSVQAGTCASGDSLAEFGYLTGNQHLIAATDAPKDIVRIDVGVDGLVEACAADPAERETSRWYDVLLQAVPN